ncbi:MAG: hypothetical protein IJZ79_07450, partial [Bacilli bacterium]|nr:hypothetical protein [Bacilli bacterium]
MKKTKYTDYEYDDAEARRLARIAEIQAEMAEYEAAKQQALEMINDINKSIELGLSVNQVMSNLVIDGQSFDKGSITESIDDLYEYGKQFQDIVTECDAHLNSLSGELGTLGKKTDYSPTTNINITEPSNTSLIDEKESDISFNLADVEIAIARMNTFMSSLDHISGKTSHLDFNVGKYQKLSKADFLPSFKSNLNNDISESSKISDTYQSLLNVRNILYLSSEDGMFENDNSQYYGKPGELTQDEIKERQEKLFGEVATYDSLISELTVELGSLDEKISTLNKEIDLEAINGVENLTKDAYEEKVRQLEEKYGQSLLIQEKEALNVTVAVITALRASTYNTALNGYRYYEDYEENSQNSIDHHEVVDEEFYPPGSIAPCEYKRYIYYDKNGNKINNLSNEEIALYFIDNDITLPSGDNNVEITSDDIIRMNYLTEDEISMLLYLQNTNDETGLFENYNSQMINTANQRWGEELYNEFLAKVDAIPEYETRIRSNFLATEYTAKVNKDARVFELLVKEGFIDGINTFFTGLEDLFNADGIVSQDQYKSMYILKYINDNYDPQTFLNKLQTAGYEIPNSIGNMALPMALGTITGNPVLGASLLGLSAGGNAREEGLQNGMSNFNAWVYGTLSGLSETTLSLVLGKIPGISNLENTTGNLFRDTICNMISEGTEESSQEIIGSILRAACLNEPLDIDLKQAGKAGIYGMVTAGLMNSGNLVLNGAKYTIDDAKAQSLIEKYKNQDLSNREVLQQVITELSSPATEVSTQPDIERVVTTKEESSQDISKLNETEQITKRNEKSQEEVQTLFENDKDQGVSTTEVSTQPDIEHVVTTKEESSQDISKLNETEQTTKRNETSQEEVQTLFENDKDQGVSTTEVSTQPDIERVVTTKEESSQDIPKFNEIEQATEQNEISQEEVQTLLEIIKEQDDPELLKQIIIDAVSTTKELSKQDISKINEQISNDTDIVDVITKLSQLNLLIPLQLNSLLKNYINSNQTLEEKNDFQDLISEDEILEKEFIGYNEDIKEETENIDDYVDGYNFEENSNIKKFINDKMNNSLSDTLYYLNYLSNEQKSLLLKNNAFRKRIFEQILSTNNSWNDFRDNYINLNNIFSIPDIVYILNESNLNNLSPLGKQNISNLYASMFQENSNLMWEQILMEDNYNVFESVIINSGYYYSVMEINDYNLLLNAINKIEDTEFNFDYSYIIPLKFESKLLEETLSYDLLTKIVKGVSIEAKNEFFKNDYRATHIWTNFDTRYIISLASEGIEFNDQIIESKEFFDRLKSDDLITFRNNISTI